MENNTKKNLDNVSMWQWKWFRFSKIENDIGTVLRWKNLWYWKIHFKICYLL